MQEASIRRLFKETGPVPRNVGNLLFRWGLLLFSIRVLVRGVGWFNIRDSKQQKGKQAEEKRHLRIVVCYRPRNVFQVRQIQNNEIDCQINCFHKTWKKTDSKERFINTHKMNQMLHTVKSPSNWFPCLCLICKEITQKEMDYSVLLHLKQQEKTNSERAQTAWTHTREPIPSSRQ